MNSYDLIIIGAGPSGLACGIEAIESSLSYLIIEKGGITDSIRRFPTNMTFFSTPELLELGNLPFTTVNVRPNRIETLEYYRRVVNFYKLNLQLHTKVTEIRQDVESFVVRINHGREYTAKKVSNYG